MSETFDAWEIPSGEWSSLNVITSIATGTELIVQNRGKPADIIECAIAANQPSESFNGVAFDQIKKQYRITPADDSLTVWVRFTRIDRGDTYNIKGLLQVQEASIAAIIEAEVIPTDIFTTENPGTRRIKTTSISREDVC